MNHLLCAIIGAVLVAPAAFAAPLSAADLKGSYVLTTDLQPGVENQVTINEDGSYEFKEVVGNSGLDCTGEYILKKDMLIAHLECPVEDESYSFTQVLELDGLTKADLKKGAQAQAHSSLFGLANPVPVILKKK
ncbi:MAG: hypothetical protein KDD43_07000 [Bdellovibrionales bacterium]|nr:hypothetical protein [Bdellovibrionales bacterium]